MDHTSIGPIRRAALLCALALLFLLWAAAPSAEAAARPSCAGKAATIVSNAAVILGTGAHDVIVAGPGSNVIRGGAGNDTICGVGGDDQLYGERGNDALLGDAGDDLLVGERGSDSLDGGVGGDRLLGESGNDQLLGGGGEHDLLDAGPGDDSLDGGPGSSDVLIGGVGNDSIDGGPGNHDLVSYRESGGGLRIDLGAGATSGAEQEILRGIEDALGGAGDDTLVGSAASANQLDGGPGNDRLEAAGEGDKAYGGPGGDVCTGFALEDSCDSAAARRAGPAVELLVSIDRSRALVLSGGHDSNRATVRVGPSGAYLVEGRFGGGGVVPGAGCEPGSGPDAVLCSGAAGALSAALGDGDDVLLLDPGVRVPATIDGGRGSDLLRGGGGDDTLYGGDDHDDDVLEGGGGDDALFGVNIVHPRLDGGAARMFGGAGNDLLVGGQPCEGDRFEGGEGDNDSASFARIRNSGTVVKATIGGLVLDPDMPGCSAGRIDATVEKIEGSSGPDILAGNGAANTLLGRGGNDLLDGRGGFDRCIEGGGRDTLRNCEVNSWRAALRKRIP